MNAEPTPIEIDRVRSALVVRHSREKRESSGAHVYADCPFCGHKDKLTLNVETGMWDCKHGECEESGALWKLADHLGIRLREKQLVRSVASVLRVGLRKQGAKAPAASIPVQRVELAHARLWAEGDADGAKVLAYLHSRGIDDDAIRHFKLGVAYIKVKDDNRTWLAAGIPYMAAGGCVLIKMRNLTDGAEPRYYRTKGGDSALFNVDGVRSRKEAVLVEGEVDAISLRQCGVTSVASTSLGAKGDVPQSWKEALADATRIVLWYDDDEAGQKAVEGLCNAFGTHRIFLAEIPEAVAVGVLNATGKRPKDCNDLVRAGVAPEVIRKIVADAKPIEVGAVQHVDTYREAIATVIQAGKAGLGAPTGFKTLDSLIRGWRPAELTFVTGHTGQGKTTWTSFAAEIQAHAGTPVLLSSFEDGPTALALRVFRRRFGRPISSLETDEDKAEAMDALPRLSEDPIYLIDHYGRVEWDDVADAIRYAVNRLGVRFVMLDHFHFIARPRAYREGHEWYEALAQNMAALCVELSIHMWVIVHVNGAVELTKIPTMDDIKGGSGIKQAAFNVLTVFRIVDVGGDATKGDIKLRDSSGRKHDIALTDRDVLIYVNKKRHPDAREGMSVIEFEGSSSSYRDRGIDVDKHAEGGARWGASAERAFADNVDEPDLFGGTQ